MIDKKKDEFYMARCIQIATNGLGNTYPNPFVGSVIVHNDKIIGEGYTSEYGGPHAEVNAVNSVKNKALLAESTIYVTLEPCAHYGKTPPCCDLIISKKIKRVVIGTIDPFAKVNGEGIKRLKDNHVNVTLGILEKECLELNKRFFTFHQKKRPYIILKWAETENGFFAPKEKKQVWISNDYSKQLVHLWRTEEQGILVGKNTVLFDNPQLNARLISGNSPIRLIIDKNLEINSTFHIYDNQQQTIVFNQLKTDKNQNTKFIQIDFSQNILPQILEHLHQENIQSIIVEGGVNTLNQFIYNQLWDEARIIKSSIRWKDGIESPKIKGKLVQELQLKSDRIQIIRNYE